MSAAGPTAEARARRGAFVRDLKALAWPALTYQAWVYLMFAVFALVLLTVHNVDEEGFWFLMILAVSTAVGITLGQVLAYLRIRGGCMFVAAVVWWNLSCLLTTTLQNAGEVGMMLALAWFLTPIFVSGGAWSLATGRALPAAWVPVIYGTGAIFTIFNSDARRLAVWRAGQKYAIWDLTTAAILFLTIALLLVYLVQRERHRLHRWRFGPRALLEGSVKERGAARARLTFLGWGALVLVGLALTAGTLVVSPYLFRTGPGDRPSDDTREGPPDPEQEPWEAPDVGMGEVIQQLAEAAQSLAWVVCPLLVALAILAAFVAAAYRPARRMLLISWLRSPPIPVAPTTRVRMGWRLILIALGDHGIEPEPTLDGEDFVRRHEAQIAAIHPELLEPLQEAAAFRDRVTYGLGIRAREMEHFVGLADRIFALASESVPTSRGARNLFREVR
ncbi:MAG: hypothetical protein ACFCGT_04745 [Sandaracinaceae bacterium]